MLGNTSPREFLADYWQKKPLLIRQAMQPLPELVTAEALTGLAIDTELESRLVRELPGHERWQVEFGPFDESVFDGLPETHWTLLVQGVDRHLPAVADLFRHFRFLPNWRLDDIMISYAVTHGSVGPHLDSYDVFLLQLQGRRQWRINEHDYSEEDCIEGESLRVIAGFRAEQEWILDPGDMLYLPPGVAHHGVALEPCLTCSIGLRAPSALELLTGFAEDMAMEADPGRRYTDTDRQASASPGEITAEDLDDLHEILMESVADRHRFARWFARQSSQTEAETTGRDNDYDLETKLHQGRSFRRHMQSRAVYFREDGGLLLYVDGQEYTLPVTLLPIVDMIAAGQAIHLRDIEITRERASAMSLLMSLYRQGAMSLEQAP